MKITVKNLSGADVREIEVKDDVLAYPYKEHLIYLAVKSYLASLRAGTHKTKTRAEVAGSGKKLWRQKGTGRARMGSVRSPIWRKGGTVHGPQPRSYADKLSTREKRNALKSALSRKLADEQVLVVENLDIDSPKTKALAGTLQGLGIERKTLLVDSFDNENLHLASRNHPKLKVVDALSVNVYDVVDRDRVVLSESALNRLLEVLDK